MGTGSNYSNLHLQTLINPTFVRLHVSRMNFGGGRAISQVPPQQGKDQDHIYSPLFSVYFVFSYRITEPAKNGEPPDKLLLSFRGFLLNQNLFQDGKDHEKIQLFLWQIVCHRYPLGFFNLLRLLISTDSYVILTVKQPVKCSFPANQTVDSYVELPFLLHLSLKKISQMPRVYFHY